MSTKDTNTAASSSVLDDVQKRLDSAWGEYNAAVEQRNQAANARAARPDAPGTSYEDFLKATMPEKPATPEIDEKAEKRNAMITNIADAINAVASIVGTANGATFTPMASLSDANQKRYNKLQEQRKADQEAYNKALMQSQSHAMNMAEAYRRKRQQEDAAAAALDDARVAKAKLTYDKASDDYNRTYRKQQDDYTKEYRQQQDAATQARSDRQESRLWKQHQDEMDYRNTSGARADLNAVESHNKDEEKKWTRLPGGKFVRNEDYPIYVDRVYNSLIRDAEIAKELESLQSQIRVAEAKGDTKTVNALKAEAVNRYLGSSDENKAKIANDAADKSGLYGEPDFWIYDDEAGKISRGKKQGAMGSYSTTSTEPAQQQGGSPESKPQGNFYSSAYGGWGGQQPQQGTQMPQAEQKQKKNIPGW